MNKWAVVLGWICVPLLLSAGCERQKPSDRQVQPYDPDVDPPASVVNVTVNPELLMDQTQVSKQYEREITAATGTPAGAAASPTTPAAATEQVKQLLAGAIDAAKTGQIDGELAIFTKQDAELFRPLLVAIGQVESDSAQLAQLVTDKLGIDIPPSVQMSLAQHEQSPGVMGGLGRLTIENLQIASAGNNIASVGNNIASAGNNTASAGNNVVVTFPDGRKQTFAPVGAQYKLAVSDKDKQLLPLELDLVKAEKKFIDEVSAGINDGSISAANFQQKAKDISDRTVAPAVAKMTMTEMSFPVPAVPGPTPPGAGSPTGTTMPAPGRRAPASGGGGWMGNVIRRATKPIEGLTSH